LQEYARERHAELGTRGYTGSLLGPYDGALVDLIGQTGFSCWAAGGLTRNLPGFTPDNKGDLA